MALFTKKRIMAMKRAPYILNLNNLGFSEREISYKYILPSLFPGFLIISLSNISSAILIEASISFLNLGIDPIIPSWGNILRESFSALGTRNIWHLIVFPSIGISMMIFTFQLLTKSLEKLYNKGEILYDKQYFFLGR